MGAHAWQSLGPQEQEPQHAPVGLGILLFILVGLMLVARLGLLVLDVPLVPQTPSPAATEILAMAAQVTPEVTATPAPPTRSIGPWFHCWTR